MTWKLLHASLDLSAKALRSRAPRHDGADGLGERLVQGRCELAEGPEARMFSTLRARPGRPYVMHLFRSYGGTDGEREPGVKEVEKPLAVRQRATVDGDVDVTCELLDIIHNELVSGPEPLALRIAPHGVEREEL